MSKKTYRLILGMALVVVCGLLYTSVYREINSSLVFAESEGYIEETDSDDVKMVMPSGSPIGIYVKTKGVMVIAIGQVKNSKGQSVSPCEELIKCGDYILEANGQEVDDKADLIDIISGSEGKSVDMLINRKGKQITVSVKPTLSFNKKYMLGIWVKDDISGIGTLTYVDEDGFGALGHSINDNDTGELFDISDGAIYKTELVNIVKSSDHTPGRLEGIINYSSSNIIGRVSSNSLYGIKGYMTRNTKGSITEGEWMPVARKTEAHLGDAVILSSVSGKPEYYKVKITGVDISASNGNKGLAIEVTDPELLKLTSGIVQGMSGTPIIQDGKLIGAITHVFVNEPTKGYGIFIEEMLGK